jgi:hypothetical protein
MRFFRSFVIVVLSLCVAAIIGSCNGEEYAVRVNDSCQAVDDDGAITELTLHRGMEIKWCNDTDGQVNIEFSVAGILPSGQRLVLAAGACEESEVQDTVSEGNYEWVIDCQAAREGSGGGPVKVEPPPPGEGD